MAGTARPSGPEASSQAACDLGRGQAEHRGHGAGPLPAGLEHELAPAAHQAGGVHIAQGPGGDVRAVLAQAVTRRRARRAEPVAHHGEHRGGMGQDGGLGVVGQGQLVLGAFPHQAGEGGAQRFVDGRERIPGGRKSLGQVLAHSDLLCPLAGTHHHGHHRMTVLPQVNPAPKATSSRSEPGFTLPSVMA